VAIAGGILAVAVLAGAAYSWRGKTVPAVVEFVPDRLTRITTSGVAQLAAISGDGRYLVHIKSERLQPSLWIRQTATASDVQIVPPASVRYDGLTFAPDGNYVYYEARSLKPGAFCHSCLSAVIGSTRIARRAGIQLARTAVESRLPAATA
jgi:hypothetical protein